MASQLFWVDGPWLGKLAVAGRPRGGDWLADEITRWKNAGVDRVLSLLTPAEQHELDLEDESNKVQAHGMGFSSFPIEDRATPASRANFATTIEQFDAALAAGKNVLIHCRQGVGRSGLVAACLLVAKGLVPDQAVKRVSAARGLSIPETAEQRSWIDHYAAVLQSSK